MRSSIESILRLGVHIFIAVAAISILVAVDHFEDATIDVNDCSKTSNRTAAITDNCYEALYDPKNTEPDLVSRKRNVFDQCYTGKFVYHRDNEYKLMPFLTDQVRPIAITCIVLLMLQAALAIASYFRGAMKITPPSKDPMTQVRWYKNSMTALSIATTLLLIALFFMFFSAISTRNSCGTDLGTDNAFKATGNGDTDIFSKDECEDFGKKMRTYADSYTKTGGFSADATHFLKKAKTFHQTGDINKVDSRYTRVSSVNESIKLRTISYASLGAYVLNCGQERGDSAFMGIGTDGKIKKHSEYKARKRLNEALQGIYASVNTATWFLAFSVAMLIYLMYSTGQLVKLTEIQFKSVHISLMPLMAAATIAIGVGLMLMYGAAGKNLAEDTPAAYQCSLNDDWVNKKYVMTKKKEETMESSLHVASISTLFFAIVVSAIAYITVIHAPTLKAKRAKRGDTPEIDFENTSVSSRINTYLWHSSMAIATAAVIGILLSFSVQRVLAPMKFHASNICDLTSPEHLALYAYGSIVALCGVMFLVAMSYVYVQFGHHGIMKAHSWYYHHSDKATALEPGAPQVDLPNGANVQLTTELTT